MGTILQEIKFIKHLAYNEHSWNVSCYLYTFYPQIHRYFAQIIQEGSKMSVGFRWAFSYEKWYVIFPFSTGSLQIFISLCLYHSLIRNWVLEGSFMVGWASSRLCPSTARHNTEMTQSTFVEYANKENDLSRHWKRKCCQLIGHVNHCIFPERSDEQNKRTYVKDS